MLVDIKLKPEDAFQITRLNTGETTLTIPLDLLLRTHALYLEQKSKFDAAASARPN